MWGFQMWYVNYVESYIKVKIIYCSYSYTLPKYDHFN